MENQIKKIRIELGLTQKNLAELAGTSQQQIQRIETGLTPARLDMAVKISAALNKPLQAIFPDLREVHLPHGKDGLLDDETYEKLSTAGIEADQRIWSLDFLLEGHDVPLSYLIPPSEQRRVFRAVQEEEDQNPFLVFDTESKRVVIRLADLSFCQFLFDFIEDTSQDEEDSYELKVFFRGASKAIYFEVEQDEIDPKAKEMPGQIGTIFFHLDGNFLDEKERLHFVDVNGEGVFLRVGNIALIEAPLKIIESDIDDEEDNRLRLIE